MWIFLKRDEDGAEKLTSVHAPRVNEVYVSREIYWWMRHPPYQVTAEFVRVDALDGWLMANGLKESQKKDVDGD